MPKRISLFEEAVNFLDEEDIAQMTPQAVYSVYKNKYWDAIHANTLPWDLAIVAFDAAVNCGVDRTNKWIEKALTDRNPVRALNEQRRIYLLNRVADLVKLVDELRVSVAEGTATVLTPATSQRS